VRQKREAFAKSLGGPGSSEDARVRAATAPGHSVLLGIQEEPESEG